MKKKYLKIILMVLIVSISLIFTSGCSNNDISEENKNKIFELQNKKESTISKVNENDKKYVKINYNNKNKAKNLGAKWDATIKSWYYIESSISEDNKKELIALQII